MNQFKTAAIQTNQTNACNFLLKIFVAIGNQVNYSVYLFSAAKRPSGVQLKLTPSRPIVAGAKWALECKGQGRPAPTFVWYKDGVEFSQNSAKGVQIKSTK